MLVLSASKDVQARVELDEDEVEELRNEMLRLEPFKHGTTISLISELLALTADDE